MGHFHQESAYTLDRSAAAQQNNSRLHSMHRAERNLADPARQVRIRLHEKFHLRTLITNHPGVCHDALDRALVSGACIEPEQISREQELHDLAAAIRYLHAFPSSPADQPIPVVGRFILAVDALVGAVPA
jgi:hypothetical protein